MIINLLMIVKLHLLFEYGQFVWKKYLFIEISLFKKKFGPKNANDKYERKQVVLEILYTFYS